MAVQKIEAILCAYLGGWERQLSASRLANLLGISREHASRKIMTWARKSFRLSNAEGSTKTVFFEEGIVVAPPGLQTPRDLINNLPGLALVCENFERPQIERIADYLSAEGEPDLFQRLYAAMRRREALLVNYRAKSGEVSLWFSPHSLVDAPHRPHFRGYAHWLRDGDGEFIDVVPSRVASIEDQSVSLYTGLAADAAWNTKRDLLLSLAEDLPEDVRSAMVQEWGHQLRNVDGRLVLRLRGIREPVLQYVKDAILWRTFRGTSYQVWYE